MTDAYADLSTADQKLVHQIALAISNGVVLPHNRTSPRAARRVFEELVHQGRLARTAEA